LLAGLARPGFRHGGTAGRRRVVAKITGRLFALDDSLDLVAGKRLIFLQAFGDRDPALLLLGHNLTSRGISLIDQAAHFVVDLLLSLFRHVLLPRHGMAEEDFFLVFAVGDLAELVGETPARDHRTGELGRLLYI